MIGSGFRNTRAFVRRFRDDTQGSMTVFGLFFFLVSGILGAIAVDVSSLYAERLHLQIAADQAAHAALYNLNVVGKDDAESKLAAIEVVKATLPLAKYGTTIEADDIQFGEYDVATDTFSADDDAFGAVQVQTAFTDTRLNAASAFLFRLIGVDSFEIYTSSTYAVYTPDCLNEGFVANGVVDMQNQNYFGAGFCVHSNTQVELQINNVFQNGAIVSMPGGKNTVVVPDDKIDDVVGLADALKDDEFDLRVLARIENMIYQYQNPTGTDFPHEGVSGDEIGWPDYITNRTMVDLGKMGTVDSTVLLPGGIYYVDCQIPARGLTITSGDGVTVEEVVVEETATPVNSGNSSGTTTTTPLPVLSEVIVISPCDVSFGQGSHIHNARVISLSTNSDSFRAPNGLTLGAVGTDGCESDGAQLVSMGGMSFAANFAGFGSQMFSMGDITFAATPTKPNDFKGISMVADGVIDMASHVKAQVGCSLGGGEYDISSTYFHMVR